jgi:hypothetical protein
MATRDTRKMNHNGNGNGSRRKARMEPDLSSTHSELIKTMIIQHFEKPPLRLNREDAERVANKMVKIAERSRKEAEKMNLP